jgi:glycosidase
MAGGNTPSPSASTPTVSAAPSVPKPVAYKQEQKSMGVFYEIFVRSFYDADGDGIGDLQGVMQKLDYLQELGIEGIWLMPVTVSPSYHGYDVTDYYNINPEYGTLDDFRILMSEAHKRGMKVVMDLVVNHTSSQHPWFIDSAKGKDSKYRDWYNWAEDQDRDSKQNDAFGSQGWYGKNGSHYLGIFWEGMPDLNFDNPEVRQEMIKAGNFWLEQGVDGFRLDAAKHIYEDMAGDKLKPETSQKNQAWWQEFRKGLTAAQAEPYLIGEVWDSAAVVAPFLNNALQSAFNFDTAKMILDSVRSERATGLVVKLVRDYETFNQSSAGKFLDAPFLANHDQNRVMSVLQGNQEHAKMAASVLLTLPGNPFLYYGEEIGMLGAKPDEFIREPMVWYALGKQGAGQTAWEQSRFNQENNVSVEAGMSEEASLFNHYKMLIHWRKGNPALRDGGLSTYEGDNKSVMTFLRLNELETLLVAHNLTDEKQMVMVDPGGPAFNQIVNSTKEGATLENGMLELPPYCTVLVK